MNTFLHAFDFGNKLKCANFASTATLNSLFTLDLIMQDGAQNPRRLPLEVLHNASSFIRTGHTSLRMIMLHEAAHLRAQTRDLTETEQSIIKRASVEIDFERVRREVAPGTPCRLSALFLAEDNEDARFMLRNMFVNIMPDPKVVQVTISNYLEMVQVDHRWLERYLENPDEQFIVNYWTGISVSANPSWEYMLEGSISLVNQEDYNEILTQTKETWPDLSLFTSS